MTWHFAPFTCSQGREGESSPTSSLGTSPSPPSKSKHIPEGCCSSGKLTDAYLDSLFGTTCKHSEPTTPIAPSSSDGPRLYRTTSQSAEDSPARTSAPQGEEQESLGSDPGFGPSLLGSFASFDPASCSWKTAQCSLFGGLESFLETWPRWGTMRSGVCWERTTSVPRTSGTGSGFWPTPASQGFSSEGSREAKEHESRTETNGARMTISCRRR
jgi:hypothetical protein